MIEIRRGTTPTIKLETEMELSSFDEIYLVIKQETVNGYVCIEKKLTEDGKIVDDTRFNIKLTQEETLALSDGRRAELQLKGRLTNGDVVSTDITELKIARVLKEEVI